MYGRFVDYKTPDRFTDVLLWPMLPFADWRENEYSQLYLVVYSSSEMRIFFFFNKLLFINNIKSIIYSCVFLKDIWMTTRYTSWACLDAVFEIKSDLQQTPGLGDTLYKVNIIVMYVNIN